MDNRFFTFVAGNSGPWSVVKVDAIVGPSLEAAPCIDVQNANRNELPQDARWMLRGVTSNQRYVTRQEQAALVAVQPQLGRPEATCAALIPLTKSAKWWALTQEERREILEDRSTHIATGLRFLPAIARKLHHSRDLGEPFDFITWFEFAPADEPLFDELVAALRRTEEWNYIEREVDIRLIRNNT